MSMQYSLFTEEQGVKTVVTLEVWKQHTKDMDDGTLTAEQHKANFHAFLDSEKSLLDEISGKYKVADLKRRLTNAYGKKAELVWRFYEALAGLYTGPAPDSAMVYLGGHGTLHKRSYLEAITEKVDAITDDDMRAHAAKKQAEREQKEKALTNPETLEELRILIRQKGGNALTDDQLALYDALVWKEDTDQRKRALAWQREREQREFDAGDGEYGEMLTIKKGWHSKYSKDIWTVGLKERIEDKGEWRRLDSLAKTFGVRRWSSWPRNDPDKHGWIFYDEQTAHDFMAAAGGEQVDMEEVLARKEAAKQERAADRLIMYSERRADAAEEALAQERLTNTWRRVQMARYAEDQARDEAQFAETVRNLAIGMRLGELEALAGVRFMTQVAALFRLRKRAWYNMLEKKEIKWVDRDKHPMSPADIRYAQMPYPWISLSTAEVAVAKLRGKHHGGSKDVWQAHVNHLRNKGKDGDYMRVVFTNMQAVVDTLPKLHDKDLTEKFADWKRVAAMGITTSVELRHALRELSKYTGERKDIDPVVEAERELIGSGKIPGFFPTMPAALEVMRDWLPDEAKYILEPSCGTGNIMVWLRDIYPDAAIQGIELRPALAEICRLKGFDLVTVGDFLDEPFAKGQFDLIVMNPPFENRQDEAHVQYAYDFLADGGTMLAIVSENSSDAFQEWIDEVAVSVDKLPEDAFKDSHMGTMTRTKLIVIEK